MSAGKGGQEGSSRAARCVEAIQQFKNKMEKCVANVFQGLLVLLEGREKWIGSSISMQKKG